MSGTIPNKLTPNDVEATFRSLPRRFGAVLSPIDERDPLFDRFERRTPSGHTPAALAGAVVEDLTTAVRVLGRVATGVGGGVVDLPPDAPHGAHRGGRPDMLLAEIATAATALGDAVAALPAEAFGEALTGPDGPVAVIDHLRRVVAGVTANLRALERFLGTESAGDAD